MSIWKEIETCLVTQLKMHFVERYLREKESGKREKYSESNEENVCKCESGRKRYRECVCVSEREGGTLTEVMSRNERDRGRGRNALTERKRISGTG